MKTGILAFLLGIMLIYQLPTLPDVQGVTVAIPLIFILFIFSESRRTLCVVLFVILGMSWAVFRAELVLNKTIPVELEGVDLVIEGTVIGMPYKTIDRLRFDFNVKQMFNDQGPLDAHRRFRLNWYREHQPVQAGEHWRFTVRVKRPSGFMNPGGFDYEGQLFQQGINATGYVKDAQQLAVTRISPLQRVHRWRQQLYSEVNDAIPELNPVIPALGLGIKDGLDQSMREVLARSGTSHLVAISGLHVGLIAGLAFFVGRWVWAVCVVTLRVLPASKAGAVCAILGASAYAALAGFSIPTQRAMLMVITFMACFLFNRQINRIDTLFITMLVVILVAPSSVMSIGFWLSFSAVAIIFYTVSGRTHDQGAWFQALRIHFVLALGLAPFLLLFFGQNPVLGPIANIVAVPVIGMLITPIVLLALSLFKVFEPLARVLLNLADYLLDGFWHFLTWIAQLPAATLTGVVTSHGVFISSIVGIALLLMPRGIPGRWLGFLYLFPLLLSRPTTPEHGDIELTLLDVGQGLAAVIRTQNHTLVYDTGPKFNNQFDTGKAVVLPFLANSGVDQLDKVIISHGDNDHRGGYQSLYQGIKIKETLSSVPEKLIMEGTQDVLLRQCQNGQQWQWDGVDFTMLHPAQDSQMTANNQSCVLKVDNGFHSILLPGDIESEAEVQLVHQIKQQLDVDILVVPHHGSKTSSTQSFINAVSPEYALFPVGYRNRYGFPKKAVLGRYTASHINVLDTAKAGAIQFYISTDIRKPDKYRQSESHFWQRNHVE